MGRPKRRKALGKYRVYFADRLEAMLERAYKGVGDKPGAFVTRHPGIVSKSTLNRWLSAEVAPNLDQIEAVAKALNTDVPSLLEPESKAKAA